MDIEFLKSISEDQTDMMMMLQLEKLPDFGGIYGDDQDPSTEFTDHGSSSSTNVTANMSQFMEDSRFASPALMNPSSTISFTSPAQTTGGEVQFLSNARWRNSGNVEGQSTVEQKRNSMAAMREMIFRIAAMQPIHIDPESVKPPKRRNVKISKDPQSVAARHRRERISERIRILQRLVPGGTKMDTASMLDEAIHYVKFLKNQVQSLEKAGENRPLTAAGIGFPVPMTSGTYIPMGTSTKVYQQSAQNVQNYLVSRYSSIRDASSNYVIMVSVSHEAGMHGNSGAPKESCNFQVSSPPQSQQCKQSNLVVARGNHVNY